MNIPGSHVFFFPTGLVALAFAASVAAALDAAASTYAEGRTTMLVFLETQRSYFNTQADYFETLQKLYDARATLEGAVGVPLAELRTPPAERGQK